MTYGTMKSAVFYLICFVMNRSFYRLSGDHVKVKQHGVTMRPGTKTSLTELLAKFHSIYGTVQVRETILAELYSSRQQDQENVSAWSCRLEDMLSKAVEIGRVHLSETNELLSCMLWTGLHQHVKDRSGDKSDAIKDSAELRL